MSTEPVDIDLAITIRITGELAEQVTQIANATSMSETAMVVAALHSYIADDVPCIRETLKGLAEADEGVFASEADVAALFRRYGV